MFQFLKTEQIWSYTLLFQHLEIQTIYIAAIVDQTLKKT